MQEFLNSISLKKIIFDTGHIGYIFQENINISIDTHEELEYAKKHFKKKFKL